MNLIRKLPFRAIPFMVMLAGCACLFFAFVAISSNTANILAWGHDGIPHLEKSNFPLFIYEAVFTSAAYSGLMFGLILVGLAAVIFFIRGAINERQTSRTFWIIWAIAVISFMISNVTLMLLPDASHFPRYLHMMFTNPDPGGAIYDQDISPYPYWPYLLPALVSLLFFTVNSFSISSRIQAIIQTIPLCLVPFIFAYYRCYTYWDIASPIHYTSLLNLLTPILVLAPVSTFIYFTRSSKSKSAHVHRPKN